MKDFGASRLLSNDLLFLVNPFSMELDTALIYLLTNSGMTKAALQGAMRKAEALGTL